MVHKRGDLVNFFNKFIGDDGPRLAVMPGLWIVDERGRRGNRTPSSTILTRPTAKTTRNPNGVQATQSASGTAARMIPTTVTPMDANRLAMAESPGNMPLQLSNTDARQTTRSRLIWKFCATRSLLRNPTEVVG